MAVRLSLNQNVLTLILNLNLNPDSILTATKTYFWEEYEHILMGAS